MRIAIFTNNYFPHVGGVARSVGTLEEELRHHGHEVLVVAPEFGDEAAGCHGDVLRVAAIRNFAGSGFSVRLPLARKLRATLRGFAPDLVHSHQPLLLGMSALREAWRARLPIVFTHHTLYEEYTHYVALDAPGIEPILRRGAIRLASEYANRCDQVIAPSASVRELLIGRGVTRPVAVIPTGIDTQQFGRGDGARLRERFGIAATARVVGHVGRLVPEKNLEFLAAAVAVLLELDGQVVFLLVGEGSASASIRQRLAAAAARGQVVATGRLDGDALADAYAAMDGFAFASLSETQGLVLAEAMAAGTPVVALDGPGARDIVNDANGILLPANSTPASFAGALQQLLADPARLRCCAAAATATAAGYARSRCAGRVLDLYAQVVAGYLPVPADHSAWERLLSAIEIEWDLLTAKLAVASAAVAGEPPGNKSYGAYRTY